MALKFGTSGIRGLNSDFTQSVVARYIEAFVRHAQTRHSFASLALAGDLRESTPGIRLMIEKTLKDLSINAKWCGNIPTPALAYFCQMQNIPGVMITGSHIPADRNGIKFYWPWGEILKADEAAITKNFESFGPLADSPDNHEQAESEFVSRYVNFIRHYKQDFVGKKVIVYQHSAVTRDLLPKILHNLGFTVECIGRSSTFVPVDTETDEAAEAINKLLGQNQKNFSAVVSSDGDGDRPLICDENLKMLRGDIIGMLTASFLGAKTVVTPVSSTTSIEKSSFFEKVVRTKIGSPFVIEGMSEAKPSPVLGFEANGGVLLGNDITMHGAHLAKLPTRDSILPILAVLALAYSKKMKISELVNTLPPRFTESGLLRGFDMSKVNTIYERLTNYPREFEKYGKLASIDRTDGLRLTLDSSNIIHFRPSGNAPEFRVYAETSDLSSVKNLLNASLTWLEKQ